MSGADIVIKSDADILREEALQRLMRSRPNYLLVIWRNFSRNRFAVAGLVVVLCLLTLALITPLLIPREMTTDIDIRNRLMPSGPGHIFGKDHLGRDVLARLLYGSRVSLTMGFIPMACSLFLGIVFGSAAVYRGGFLETIIMRACDILSCIPGVLLALTLVAVLGPGLNNVMIAITIAAVPDMTRYVRSVILNIVGLEYIEAARACGTGTGAIIARHVIPNAAGPLILSAVSNIASMIMIGAGLSYLGLGIQLPNPEWGAMLADGQNYFLHAPHLMLVPGLTMLIAVLSFNLMGDGLRDALDPKLR